MNPRHAFVPALVLALITAAGPSALSAQATPAPPPPFTYATSLDPSNQTWRVIITNPGPSNLKCIISYSTVDNINHPQSGTRLAFVPSPNQVPGAPASGVNIPFYFRGFLNLSATVSCVTA